MIRYKVVRENRGSCVVPPQSHNFYRKYEKGDTVYSAEDSFGIMVFDNHANAELFRLREFAYPVHYKTLKVKPIGKKLKEPQFLFMPQGLTWAYRYFKKFAGKHFGNWIDIPRGTLFYRAVKVLD